MNYCGLGVAFCGLNHSNIGRGGEKISVLGLRDRDPTKYN